MRIKRKKTVAAVAAIAVLGVAGAGYAYITRQAPIGGDSTVSTLTPTVRSMSLTSATDMTCDPTATGGVGHIGVTDTYGASSCDLAAVVGLASGDAPAYVVGVEDAGLPDGYSLTLESGCGLTLDSGPTGTRSVGLRLALDNTAASASWSSGGVGVKVVPVSQMTVAQLTAACA